MDLAILAEWVAAIGTSGALIVSLWIVLEDRRSRRIDQARRISVWSEWKRVPGGHDPTPRQFFVYIHNSSDSPIFVEQLRAVQWHGADEAVEEEVRWGVVPAHAIDDYGLEESLFDPNLERPIVEMTFSDVDALRWFRDSFGKLKALGREEIEA
jgi:hypothetical protein